MISPSAYELWSVIVTGPCDIHTLHRGILHRTGSETLASELLLSNVIELSEKHLIAIELHRNYGRKPGTKPLVFPVHKIVSRWLEFFGAEGPIANDIVDTWMVYAINTDYVVDSEYVLYEQIYSTWEINNA